MNWLRPLLILTILAVTAVNAGAQPQDIPTEERIESPLVDRMHTGVKTRLDRYARYFDSFFEDERADEEAADSRIRLIGSLAHREGNGFDFTPRIKARLNLPHLKRKVNLLIDTESDNLSTLAEQVPGAQSNDDLKEETSIAVQLVQKSSAEFGLSHRIDLRLKGEELNPRFKSQVRFTWQTSDRDLLRFTQAVFWERFDGTGQESRFDYEHLLHRKATQLSSLLRITLRGLTSEASDGYEWSLPIEILNALPKRRAYSYGGSISGVTDTDSGITNSTVFCRYRQSLWRDWFYFDLTPQLEWPKVNGRNTTASITFSLEILL